jgi:uncharacterized protein YjbI with pentapeptide repeats/energy-coupling factor transporter ATP-binding protein EcfA2
VLLEDEVLRLVEADARGAVAVLGPSGSGKTTALAHLAAVLPPGARVALLDEPKKSALVKGAGVLQIYTSRRRKRIEHQEVYDLSGWDPDDWLEYVLARHRPQCASVMARLELADRILLGGSPSLWTVVLDRLAADDCLPDARRALHRYVEEHLSDADLLQRARSACLNAQIAPDADLAAGLSGLARPGFETALVNLMRHEPVQTLLAAERIADDLHGGVSCDFLARPLPRELVRMAGSLCASDEAAREQLRRLLGGPSWSHPMAASLLHAMRVGWVPGAGTENLSGAYLDGADWPGVMLPGVLLSETDLTGANLRGAVLENARAVNARLHGASLREARLYWLRAWQADLSGADLSGAWAAEAVFAGARLIRADLSGAVLCKADLSGADLSGAVLTGADLKEATLKRAVLEGANFTAADLTGAKLSGLRLREATWDGACFRKARLEECDLEGLTLPAADFAEARLRRALLTGTVMPSASFRRTNLREAGMAGVEWEGADLRDADLRGASFHLGSTRSGLVGSPIACEGSRTGFYTDEYEEQEFKPPEEIRKANLCGADLRGARLDGVDFYLVDLRGARYDADRARHLRRCGAILEARG